MLTIVTHEFEIHTTPLEKIIFDVQQKDILSVSFDNIEGKRITIIFGDIKGISISHEEILDYSSIELDGDFPRTLLEVKPLEWQASYISVPIAEIDKRVRVGDTKYRHFILPFTDYFLEVLCSRYEIVI